MPTIYVTKYALTSGIHEVSAEKAGTTDGCFSHRNECGWTTYYYPRHYTMTSEEAIRRAEAMRVKKIALLEKQIAKLKKMKFEIKEG